MDADERQRLWDYWECAAIEAGEGLREALADLRRELMSED